MGTVRIRKLVYRIGDRYCRGIRQRGDFHRSAPPSWPLIRGCRPLTPARRLRSTRWRPRLAARWN